MKQRKDQEALAKLYTEGLLDRFRRPQQPAAAPQGQAPVAPQGQQPAPQGQAPVAPTPQGQQPVQGNSQPVDLNSQFTNIPPEIGKLLPYVVDYGGSFGRNKAISQISPLTNGDPRLKNLQGQLILSDKGYSWNPYSNETKQLEPEDFKDPSGYQQLQQLVPSLAQQPQAQDSTFPPFQPEFVPNSVESYPGQKYGL